MKPVSGEPEQADSAIVYDILQGQWVAFPKCSCRLRSREQSQHLVHKMTLMVLRP